MVVDAVDHPSHYGGADNPYEAIKVIDAWALGFSLGNAVKYICRAGKKHLEHNNRRTPDACRESRLEDLKKARWYLDHEIAQMEQR